MAEKALLTPELEAELGALGSVDLVVGVTALERPDDARAALATVQAGLAARFADTRAVVLYAHAGAKRTDLGNGGTPVLDLPCDAVGAPWPRTAGARLVLEASHRLRARGCALVGAEVTSLTPEWIGRLLAPVVDQDQDLVMPCYSRHPYSGAINSGIVYPLIRALYGKQLRYPLGAEFACSGRLVERLLAGHHRREQPGPQSLELQLLAQAVTGGMGICQAVLGPRTVVAGDTAGGVSGFLMEALAPVFADMERSSALWQKIRGSAPVELKGVKDYSGIEPVTVDRKRLLDAFRLGQQNLQEVWGLALPPGTLVELKKLARSPEAEFHLPDRLWARIVFDFSLAYRIRSMSRDHLMGALAPLYLGWLGSLHAELGEAEPARLEGRLEQMCQQFEGEKPYLISRWRWPDRFNP